jgi:predicted TIM-barrel fold metal-dependent hydrolase
MESDAERFVFGSDWPDVPSIGRQVERIRQLPLSGHAIQAILWENGARLLKIDT